MPFESWVEGIMEENEDYGEIFHAEEEKLRSYESLSDITNQDAAMSPLTKAVSVLNVNSSPTQTRKRPVALHEGPVCAEPFPANKPPSSRGLSRKNSTGHNGSNSPRSSKAIYPSGRRPISLDFRSKSFENLKRTTTLPLPNVPIVVQNGPFRTRSNSVCDDMASQSPKLRRGSVPDLLSATIEEASPVEESAWEHIPYLPLVHVQDKLARNRISAETLIRLLQGEWKEKYQEMTIIDCRFKYEYEGGHIANAINISEETVMEKFLFTNLPARDDKKKRLFIFHCEYSQSRGPTMYDYVRKRDREENLKINRYPHLFFPEMYVLNGGYKEFYETMENLSKTSQFCKPPSYISMHHPNFKEQCSHDFTKFKRRGLGVRRTMSL